MARIFVSYSRVDKDVTKQFVDRLSRLHQVWYDQRLLAGDKWWAEILRQIDLADIFIYLLSNDSLESPFCQAEYQEAVRLQKPILTVQVRGRTRIPSGMDDIQYVDMSSGLNDLNLTELLEAIQKQSENLPRRKPRAKWTPATPRPKTAESDSPTTNQQTQTLPTVQAPTPQSAQRRLNEPWAIIIATVIMGLFALGAALSGVFNGSGDSADPLERNEVVNTQVALAFTQTQTANEIATEVASRLSPTNSPTQTSAPIVTPTFTPSHTPIPLGFPGNPVTANDQWTPIEQEFGGVTMVLVPVGCFMMGSDDGESNEQPVHEQCFDAPFWIDKYEVTNVLYGGPSNDSTCNADSSAPDQPRNCVDWFEALGYCQSRGGEFSLPTEREWEYAARGPDSLTYPWGNEFVDDTTYVIWSENSGGQTAAISGREDGASWIGAQDMAGNLWEWTRSLYVPYPYVEDDGRENLEDNTNTRAVRGGSFFNSINLIRSVFRNWDNPDFINIGQGFRCSRSY